MTLRNKLKIWLGAVQPAFTGQATRTNGDFGLDDIPDNDIQFLYPKKKIKTIDITFSPYNNDIGSNINENEILEKLIIELIDYFFDKQGYYYGKVIEKDQHLKVYSEKVSKKFLSNYDAMKEKWDTIKQKKETNTTKQLKQQLQGLQNNIVNNSKVTRDVRLKNLKAKELIMKLKVLKSKCLVKYEKKNRNTESFTNGWM